MKKLFVFIFLFFCLFLTVASAHAQPESILSFKSKIKIHPDSSMTVREDILVNSTGKKIKRGIYRDFPTRYTDSSGRRYNVGFKVLEVLRDNKPEQYHLENRSNGQRIYIGKPNFYLHSDQYFYTIVYTTNRQLGFFADHDELYWNVTGNGWEFPIDKASAEIELPAGASMLRAKGFTGGKGSKEEDVEITQKENDKVLFKATRPLGIKEGLTIVVSWPKGFVEKPSTQAFDNASLGQTHAKSKRQANSFFSFILILFSFFAIVVYYIVVWLKVGKDPAKGTIIPLFHPPKGMSPAFVRYVFHMGFDMKAFTSSILSLAVKGYLVIVEDKKGVFNLSKKYILKRTGKKAEGLFLEEKAILDILLKYEEIALCNNNYEDVQKAIAAVKKALSKSEAHYYFHSNIGYSFFGIFVSALFVWATFFFMLYINFDLIFLMDIILGCLAVLFFWLLKAPTLQGRKTMDQIEGFKMFLAVTDKDRFNELYSKEKTPELFEANFPYALALGVDQKWSEQFSDVFERLSSQGTTYCPSWYLGGSFYRGIHSFSNVSNSLLTAISSSSTPPGSSSGFGGGGFSGGGGGGGGGGGW